MMKVTGTTWLGDVVVGYTHWGAGGWVAWDHKKQRVGASRWPTKLEAIDEISRAYRRQTGQRPRSLRLAPDL